ncbi:beta-ketoacyl synthase N-terminal-like domain-containing protein [Vibrio splendidus]
MLEEEQLSVAIVGMSCRFPGAETIDEFWQNLLAHSDVFETLSVDEAVIAGADPKLAGTEKYVRLVGRPRTYKDFDPAFFNLTPNDALALDPQHRLLLLMGYEALEEAGLADVTEAKNVAVFTSLNRSSYLMENLWSNQEIVKQLGLNKVHYSNDKGYSAVQLSHKFNLTGSSMAIDSTCSSSLTAVDLAVKSLLMFETDAALVGASSINANHAGYLACRDSIASDDGRCRAFDEAASGTIFTSGGGAILLKRHEDAIRDGDHIYAIIRGSAVNNDGADKQSFAAPSKRGQHQALCQALANSGLTPDDLDYWETHGTGTAVGDPIELASLSDALAGRKSVCEIGALKPNIGHLDSAAGLAGLIKAALVLKHGINPGLMYYEQPNPSLNIALTSLSISRRPSPLPAKSGPWYAGVSSLGVGGTNVHVCLEQPKSCAPKSSFTSAVITVSAKTEASLAHYEQRLTQYLAKTKVPLQDIGFSYASGRGKHEYVSAWVINKSENGLCPSRIASRQGLGGLAYKLKLNVQNLSQGILDYVDELKTCWPVLNDILLDRSTEPSMGIVHEVLEYLTALLTFLRRLNIEVEIEGPYKGIIAHWPSMTPKERLSSSIELTDLSSASQFEFSYGNSAAWSCLLDKRGASIFSELLAKISVCDRNLNLSALYDNTGAKRVRLPSYVFDLKEYWVKFDHVPKPVWKEKKKPSGTVLNYEELVMNCWCDQLGVSQVDIHSDFYQLGGDSMLAINVISELETALEMALPISLLLEYPVCGDFIDRVSEAVDNKSPLEESTFEIGEL